MEELLSGSQHRMGVKPVCFQAAGGRGEGRRPRLLRHNQTRMQCIAKCSLTLYFDLLTEHYAKQSADAMLTLWIGARKVK